MAGVLAEIFGDAVDRFGDGAGDKKCHGGNNGDTEGGQNGSEPFYGIDGAECLCLVHFRNECPGCVPDFYRRVGTQRLGAQVITVDAGAGGAGQGLPGGNGFGFAALRIGAGGHCRVILLVQKGIGTHQEILADQIGLAGFSHAGAFPHDGVDVIDEPRNGHNADDFSGSIGQRRRKK